MYAQRARQERIVLATNKPWTSYRVYTRNNYSSPSRDEINIPTEEFPSTTTHIRSTCSCAASMSITYQQRSHTIETISRDRIFPFAICIRSDCSELPIEFDIYIYNPTRKYRWPPFAFSSGLKGRSVCAARKEAEIFHRPADVNLTFNIYLPVTLF